MPFITCPNGHKFNPEKFTACPYCAKEAAAEASLSEQIGRVKNLSLAGSERTEAYRAGSDGGVTIGIFHDGGFDPVTGWLVCVDGPDRGRDFRLRRGKNFVGRSPSCDVYIPGDGRVSARHFDIVYDPEGGGFIMTPQSSALVYLNGTSVYSYADLSDGDLIKAGDTLLKLAIFCKNGFKW